MDNYVDNTAKLIHEMVLFSKEFGLKMSIVTNGSNDLTLVGDQMILDFSNPTDDESFKEIAEKFERIKLTIYQSL
jgi:hypothetical protein